jgi:hypothetical protein
MQQQNSQPSDAPISTSPSKQMKADASEAEARSQKLKGAGRETWMALTAAVAESRKALDRANQASWDALKRAAPPKT